MDQTMGGRVVVEAKVSPVYATLIYHILVPAHGPDICTAVTAHHPNFKGRVGVFLMLWMLDGRTGCRGVILVGRGDVNTCKHHQN